MKKVKNKEAKLIAGIHILNNWINQDSNPGYLETMPFLRHCCLEQAKLFSFGATLKTDTKSIFQQWKF